MRCSSYCIGDEYNLTKMTDHLKTIDVFCNYYYSEVVYIRFPLEHSEERKSEFAEALVFKYGCVVFWGSSHHDEKVILKRLARFCQHPLPAPVVDVCKYEVVDGAETEVDEENDLITLGSDAPILKVSVAYGLSQSVKLSRFEELVDKTIDMNKKIPQELIRSGQIRLSRRTLAHKMGELFAVKNLINLHSAILDVPEFFWRKPKYEPYYNMTVGFLDIHKRIDILNKRIDVIHELYMMLSNEQQHIHSSRLEWIVILLIMMEVIIAVLRDIMGWI
ncbi:MAG: RMD1 family protein [Proteobacteria bacterium]|nr:RMD1 family protein [Pseudomonadota bacterium]